MQKHPVSAALLIVALAIVPNFVNFLSGAYIKKLETRPIMLTAAATNGGRAASDAVSAAETSEVKTASPMADKKQSFHQTDAKLPFMSVPGRILAGNVAGREIAVVAHEIEANGAAFNSSITPRPPFSSRQNRPPESRGKPDSSNLAQDSTGGTTAPVTFTYKIDRPLWHSSTVVILLHGSGGDETTLMPFARPIWPRATLVGIRGRIMQGKERRWYHKITPTSFNRQEAEQEAALLAQFITDLAYKKHYKLQKIVFVGYSNGANILAIMAMKYPHLVRRAILLRPMPVLNPMPQGDLHNLRILTLSGARDTLYGGFAEPLYSILRQEGAHVTSYRIAATHMLGREDAKLITRWLKLGY